MWLPEGIAKVFRTDSGAAYEKTAETKTYVQALPPGRYVIAGVAFKGMGGVTCMCMGTVAFEAKPGMLTDLGYLLSGIDWRHPQESWRPTSMG